MVDTFRKVLRLLTAQERRRAVLLLGLIFVNALLAVVGVASILPFMAVLANPEVVQTNDYLHAAYEFFGFRDTRDFLFFLGVIVFVAFVVSTGFKAFGIWAINRFTQMRQYSIARRLLSGYLAQPYEWYLGRHSADLGSTILNEVQLVVQGSIFPLILFCSQAVLVVAMFALLIVVDPLLAVVMGGGIGGAYVITYLLLRRLLGNAGKERVKANKLRFKALNETFGGIKEVKFQGVEDLALERFSRPAKKFVRAQVFSVIAANLPRFAFEIIAFGGILAVTLTLVHAGNGLESALPLMALYAMAGYRLMPALQSAYMNMVKLRFSSDALDRLFADLHGLAKTAGTDVRAAVALRPREQIKLADVSYKYPGAEQATIDSLDLEIPVGSKVGFVGSSGAGKTTLVDLILGLLEPTSGELQIDSTRIDATNRKQWQRAVAYVPQFIFLIDDTIASNIAFGVSEDELDLRRVERAAKHARLHDFIKEELPEGYATRVGERGVRLSGGQRQRIGIARALYRNPSVLVLDEATSALDSLTEEGVMEAIGAIDGVTCLIVAHRLATVRGCDVIFLLENGRVLASGKYAELEENSPVFRKMAIRT
jgi:ABC-type multidrug transport system fused ATPase/permease subunit